MIVGQLADLSHGHDEEVLTLQILHSISMRYARKVLVVHSHNLCVVWYGMVWYGQIIPDHLAAIQPRLQGSSRRRLEMNVYGYEGAVLGLLSPPEMKMPSPNSDPPRIENPRASFSRDSVTLRSSSPCTVLYIFAILKHLQFDSNIYAVKNSIKQEKVHLQYHTVSCSTKRSPLAELSGT